LPMTLTQLSAGVFKSLSIAVTAPVTFQREFELSLIANTRKADRMGGNH
jgi:hypothetical protein